MDKPKLGQKVHIQAFMSKGGSWATTQWNRVKVPLKTMEGIYIGTRRVYEGETDYGYMDDWSWSFLRTKQINCWLVVTNENLNPRYVLPEDCRLVPVCPHCGYDLEIDISDNYYTEAMILQTFCPECDCIFETTDYLFEDDLKKYRELGVKV